MFNKLKAFFESDTDLADHTIAVDADIPEKTAIAEMSDEELQKLIVDALCKVYDPEIPVNIYELGLIYSVEIDADLNVNIKMTLTAPGCPVAATFPKTVEDTVKANVAMIKEVNVELVWDPPWTMERMSDAAKLQLGMFG